MCLRKQRAKYAGPTYGKGFGIEVIGQGAGTVTRRQPLQIGGHRANRAGDDPHRRGGDPQRWQRTAWGIHPGDRGRAVGVGRRVRGVRCRDVGRSVGRWQVGGAVVGRWRGVGVGGALRRWNHSGRRADNANRRWWVYDAGHHAGGRGYHADGRGHHPGCAVDAAWHRVARVDGVTRLVHLYGNGFNIKTTSNMQGSVIMIWLAEWESRENKKEHIRTRNRNVNHMFVISPFRQFCLPYDYGSSRFYITKMMIYEMIISKECILKMLTTFRLFNVGPWDLPRIISILIKWIL